MLSLQITALYGSLLAIILVVLTVYVIRQRLTLKVGLGDGGQPALMQATRAHGNFVEFTPFMLALLAIFELNGGSALWLYPLGAIIVLGRIFHAIAIIQSTKPSLYRMLGMNGTFIPIITLAVLNLLGFLKINLLGSYTW